MLDKLEAIQDRYFYLEEQLADPEVVTDMNKYKKVSKEYKNLKEIVEVYQNYKEVLGNIETSAEMLKEDDDEMKEMAQMELDDLNPQKEELEERLKVLLIPKDRLASQPSIGDLLPGKEAGSQAGRD